MESFNSSSSDESPLQERLAAGKLEAQRQAHKAAKRRATLIKKTNDFHRDCKYQVILVLQKGHRSWIHTSLDSTSLLSTLPDIVSNFPH
jgi:hypothetical protein